MPWLIMIRLITATLALAASLLAQSPGPEQIAQIFAPIVKRPARPAWTGSARRTPSTRPPVQSPKELALTNGAQLMTPPPVDIVKLPQEPTDG